MDNDYIASAVDATVDIWRQSIVKEFNDTLLQFITKLQKVYRDIPELKNEFDMRSTIIEQITSKNDKFFVDNFYRVAQASGVIPVRMSEWKREDFMENALPHIKLLQSLRIMEFWDKTPERTRESIWQYIQKLWQLSHDFFENVDRDELSTQAINMLKRPEFHKMMKNILG